MPNVCILTDSTVQFTQSNFPGHELVHVIPFGIQDAASQEESPLPGGFPVPLRLIPPSPQEFIQHYTRLSRTYDSILVLTLSSLLNSTLKHALLASRQFSNGTAVEVMDSGTTASGLGMLVQLAAGAAYEGASLHEVERRLRANILRVYMLYCIPDLTYLAYSGLMDHSQALVAEMMGMLPIFNFEEGGLVPMEKVHTPRRLFEAFLDFLGEFEVPSRIALAGNLPSGQRAKSFRQVVKETFPETPYSEHPVQPHLATLFGPRSIGLAVMDSVDERRK